MKQLNMLAYLESTGEEQQNLPFNRYAPPCPPGIVTKWLAQHAQPGAKILEPIGASPAAILEMAEAGYQVLTAVNNPVTAFELTLMALAPAQSELQSVFGELSIQRKGEERLAAHLLNVYGTRCSSCGKEISADYLKWRRSEETPFLKGYHCPACGDEGERPCSDADYEKLTVLKRSDPLHRARAIERVPGGTRESRQNLEELLKIYPPRQLYVLSTLINKLEGMNLPPQRRMLMEALILSGLDAGHILWPADPGADRPRGVTIPAEYIEKNVWKSLEHAIQTWGNRNDKIPLTFWPEQPKSAGICLYPGRMRDLYQQKPPFMADQSVCVLPRPNQVFWTLSILWSAWLWGKENAANLKNVLERQRFDWYWHANALQSALAPAARMAAPASSLFAIISQPVPGFIAAVFEACSASSLQCSGITYKDETSLIQTEWNLLSSGFETKKANYQKIIHEAIRDCLNQNGEPCRYLKLYTCAIAALAENNALPSTIQQMTYDAVGVIHNEIAKVFTDRKFLRRLEASAQDLDSGFWWLAQPEGCQVALADRVETEVVSLLQKEPQINSVQLRQAINTRFMGYLTPPDDILHECMQSYADYDQTEQKWTLKKNETVSRRRNDLAEICLALAEIAGKIGFQTDGENPILWSVGEPIDQPVYRIFLSASALLSRFINQDENLETETVFLFPGSRSGLLRYKMDRDPWLRERIPPNWHFVKYRTLRELVRRKDLSKDIWDLFIDSDPISLEDATQLSIFL